MIIWKGERRRMRKKEKERTQRLLFGVSRGTRCNFVNLAKDTGIAESTLRRYAQEPEKMSLGRFFVIVKAMELTPEQVGYMVTGKEK